MCQPRPHRRERASARDADGDHQTGAVCGRADLRHRRAYEKVVGRFRGELDPKSPLNAAIVDLDKAPRNAHGMVEYSADFYILKPVDVTKGNGAGQHGRT